MTYDPKLREAHWQQHWEDGGIYHFRDDKTKAETFVMDTPPPTVSGVLHMGHIFSYTQADFVARYKRMRGFDVFYPMGFDDNGLPTERLVEKVKGVRAVAMANEENGREKFVALCREVVAEAELEFKKLFQSVALSVDWRQLYQTVSDEVTALSQASFLDLIAKDEAYRDFKPTYWDWVDQTAIASAEIEEKELPGVQITIPFGIMDAKEWEDYAADASKPRPDFSSLEPVHVMTTRPELLGACVALMVHPDDEKKYAGKVAVTPLFNVVVPICADEKVDKEKGTGFVMCCSWGDDTDKEWIQKHVLAWRPLVTSDGKLLVNIQDDFIQFPNERNGHPNPDNDQCKIYISGAPIHNNKCFDTQKAITHFKRLLNDKKTKLIRDIKNENSAKGRAIEMLDEAGLLIPQGEKQEKIITKTQTVKCAERSGSPVEIIPTSQWFVRICDKKEALLAKGAQCEWKPEYMRIRLNQWIEGLKEDWCISRQRFFGVPFPVWYVRDKDSGDRIQAIYADPQDLPVDPFVDMPRGYVKKEVLKNGDIVAEKDGKQYLITPDKDVLDTWATSSISPQINARSIHGDSPRAEKLFPADVRPQAHEIIRTWAFYTIVKAHLHANTTPWKTLMISGWCLAADKSKMSKSKGNVVTPVALIEDKGADAVRYWASTSRLGADTAFSEDLLKIGKKLVNKLYNASNFAGQHLSKITPPACNAKQAVDNGLITETLDKWILTRLYHTVDKATAEFERFEYAAAREHIEHFFWRDFCDNYLELVKARSYGQQDTDSSLQGAEGDAAIQKETSGDPGSPRDFVAGDDGMHSAIYTLHYCLNTLCKLFAPYVPHITEELYSTLFASEYAQAGSVHARNQWPNAEDFINDSACETIGEACLELLEAVRKAKSEANVSIKYPVELLIIAQADYAGELQSLAPILEDLKAAGNITQIELSQAQQSVTTELGHFSVSITLAKQAASA